MNRFWIILTVVIVAMIGIFIVTKKDDTPKVSIQGDPRKVSKIDHVKGAEGAPVTLIEYADFQCPGCASYYPILKSLEQTYEGRVRFVFRHFPLTQIHPNAFAAARAAEAAGKQNKFFEMHNKLFETQQVWGQTTSNQQSLFEGYAKELGLDLAKFKSDYVSGETADRINLDVTTGQETFGVNSTPTFVLNGKKISNPKDLDEFKKVIDDELKKVSNGTTTN